MTIITRENGKVMPCQKSGIRWSGINDDCALIFCTFVDFGGT